MSTAVWVSPTKMALFTSLGSRSGFPIFSFASLMSWGVSRLQSFTGKPHDSAGTELYYAVRFNLDAIVNLLEFLSVVEECAVLAVQILQHQSCSAHSEFRMFSRDFLIWYDDHVFGAASDTDDWEVVELYRDL